jgi:HlyD family secretion protein
MIKSNGDTVVVKTGLKDYQKVEILSGIKSDDELLKPEL